MAKATVTKFNHHKINVVMSRTNQAVLLQQQINHLQQQQQKQVADVKAAATILVESVKPINILKSAVHSITTEPTIKENVVDAAVGLVTGLITKKLVVGKSSNIFKKLLGDGIQFLVTNFVINKLPIVKSSLKTIEQNDN